MLCWEIWWEFFCGIAPSFSSVLLSFYCALFLLHTELKSWYAYEGGMKLLAEQLFHNEFPKNFKNTFQEEPPHAKTLNRKSSLHKGGIYVQNFRTLRFSKDSILNFLRTYCGKICFARSFLSPSYTHQLLTSVCTQKCAQ